MVVIRKGVLDYYLSLNQNVAVITQVTSFDQYFLDRFAILLNLILTAPFQMNWRGSSDQNQFFDVAVT